MAFTVREFQDLIRILEKHPEWREQLRHQVLTDELLELPQIVRNLGAKLEAMAEFQRRSYEEFVASRAETDRRFQELAEAQRRTEGRLEQLERHTYDGFAALSEAQRRTEARVEELAVAQRQTDQSVRELARIVGRLQETVGGTVEESAESALMVVLEAKGYQLVAKAFNLSFNGEVDVVQEARDQNGNRLWGVAEAKVRLGWSGIEDWANRMRSEGFRKQLAEKGIPGPYLVYAFGLRVEQRATDAAQKFGIGLLTDRGEYVAPAGEIAGVQ